MKDSSDVGFGMGVVESQCILFMDAEPGEGASEFHIHLPILSGLG